MINRTVLVNKDKLCERLAMGCSNYHIGQDGTTAYCSRRLPEGCNVEYLDKILWHCPSDCVHWREGKWKVCEPEKCSWVKKAIKELMEI